MRAQKNQFIFFLCPFQQFTKKFLTCIRIEMRSWENRLDSALEKVLSGNQQPLLDSALDHLFHTDLAAYDGLLDAIEAVSSSCTVTHKGQRYDALLLAIPILAWTRFSIPAGLIPEALLQNITAHLHGHVLAADTQAVVAPVLFAIDQLPRSYCDTYLLTHRMAEAALSGMALQMPAELPETAPFLADTRFVLLAVTAPAGAPLLRFADLETDTPLLEWARALAPQMLDQSPDLAERHIGRWLGGKSEYLKA